MFDKVGSVAGAAEVEPGSFYEEKVFTFYIKLCYKLWTSNIYYFGDSRPRCRHQQMYAPLAGLRIGTHTQPDARRFFGRKGLAIDDISFKKQIDLPITLLIF